MASNCIPQIDIAPMLAGDPVGKRRIAEQVRDALETIGFFTIVGHGVPEVVVRDARDVAYEFFALPLAEKMRKGADQGDRDFFRRVRDSPSRPLLQAADASRSSTLFAIFSNSSGAEISMTWSITQRLVWLTPIVRITRSPK